MVRRLVRRDETRCRMLVRLNEGEDGRPYSFSRGLFLVVPALVFFFFQAEDGIRDLTMTGVQTCALPISARCCRLPQPSTDFRFGSERSGVLVRGEEGRQQWEQGLRAVQRDDVAAVLDQMAGEVVGDEIGRASCRERG